MSIFSGKNQNQKEKLAHMLEDWAKWESGNAENLASLRLRIESQLADDELSKVELPVPTSIIERRRPWVLVLTTAAVAMIAVGLWQNHRNRTVLLDTPGSVALESEPWSVYLQTQRRLLSECREVFGQQLAWVTEKEGSIVMRLWSDDFEALDNRDRYVAIRLILWARSANENQWKRVQTTNVLAAREQFVEFPALNKKKALFALWTYLIEEDLISIDLRYQLPESAGLSFEDSSILQLGKSTNLHAIGKDGVEYRLDQTADLLDTDDLG